MFKKLVKYDFKSVGKWYLLLNAITLAIALLLGFAISNFSNYEETQYSFGVSQASSVLNSVLILSFGILISAVIISTLVIVVNRFRTNVLGREGYLTLTLPASIHEIILSKLCVATLLTFFNIFVIIVSIVLLILPSSGISEFIEAFKELTRLFTYGNTYLGLLFFIISSISGTLMIYFSIAIGQLFNERRLLMAFVAYFGLFILSSIVGQYFFGGYVFTQLIYVASQDYNLIVRNYMLIAIFYSIMTSLLFYFGTHYIMKNKLNLE
ncbi:ABC transporter permease [Streptococcus caprae]|uniref:ABC transporter permease n=1 Tax=Streptococcus caprae TaxID=1640501 RepID=A0ABV8CSM2_9STRE